MFYDLDPGVIVIGCEYAIRKKRGLNFGQVWHWLLTDYSPRVGGSYTDNDF